MGHLYQPNPSPSPVLQGSGNVTEEDGEELCFMLPSGRDMATVLVNLQLLSLPAQDQTSQSSPGPTPYSGAISS